jgi:hypothetical protein
MKFSVVKAETVAGTRFRAARGFSAPRRTQTARPGAGRLVFSQQS